MTARVPAPGALPGAPDPRPGHVDPRAVQAMFDGIARHYDLLNTVLSGGRDAAWRRRAVREARLRPTDSALDVCCGTGALARGLRKAVGPAGRVVGVDFSEGMLSIARRRIVGVEFRQDDATTLSAVDDRSVDAVTMAFGLRNIPDRQAALRAAFRVLRPGGRIVVLEFAPVGGRVLGRAYGAYSTRLLPRLGRLVNPGSEAYRYLPASIAAYPDAAVVSGWLRQAGFEGVRVVRMTFGIVSLHVGVRPEAGTRGARRHAPMH